MYLIPSFSSSSPGFSGRASLWCAPLPQLEGPMRQSNCGISAEHCHKLGDGVVENMAGALNGATRDFQ